MLKRLLDTLDGVPEALHEFYEEKDGKFHLLAEAEDTSALKSAKDHEKEARQKAEQELRDLRAAEADKIAKAEEAARAKALKEARENSDFDALDKSWKEKFDALKAEKNAETAALQDAINGEKIKTVAGELASEISIAPALLQPLIEARLSVELTEGKFNTRVLDAAGQPSALSIDDLRAEFVGNDAFKGVMKAGNASGGGATNSNGGGAANKPFAEMTASERVALKQSNPDQFRKMASESQGHLNRI